MKVKIIKTGKIEEFNPGYAVRLIEQGQAIPVDVVPEPAPAPAKGGKAEKSGK